MLDTETGSDVVPEYAVSPAGGVRSTSFYYRHI